MSWMRRPLLIPLPVRSCVVGWFRRRSRDPLGRPKRAALSTSARGRVVSYAVRLGSAATRSASWGAERRDLEGALLAPAPTARFTNRTPTARRCVLRWDAMRSRIAPSAVAFFRNPNRAFANENGVRVWISSWAILRSVTISVED